MSESTTIIEPGTNGNAPHPPAPSAAPPKSAGYRAIAIFMTVALAALVLGVAFAKPLSSGAQTLLKATGFSRSAASANAKETHGYYTCSMHPWVLETHPGDCPICAMPLVPIDPAKFSGSLTIDPTVVQNIGVRTQPVVRGPLVMTVRTVGDVTYDEARLYDVNTKFGGWIESLKVDTLGQKVGKGDVLFDVYSPQIYAAQEEYLLALKNRGAGAVADTNRQLLDSAKTRLDYFDLGDAQIGALKRRGTPAKTVAVRSPFAGVVVDKMATDGMKIDPGMRVYRLADLSTVWVQATVYEDQLPYVRQGQGATMTLAYLPGKSFEGKVVYVYPYLNEKTRQAKVRLEFPNADGLLKPGMFAQVELKNVLEQTATLAPQSAVIDTGTRKVAFVSRGGGKFEPRDVTTGTELADGTVQILAGLKPGELVVTSGQFLLDSEARTREALAKLVKGTPAATVEQAAPAEPAKAGAMLADRAAAVDDLLSAYLNITAALGKDSTDGIASAARKVAAAAGRIDGAAGVKSAADTLAAAGGDLKAARAALATLSAAVVPLIESTGVPSTFVGGPVERLHCPMYRHEADAGAAWLQPAGEVRNPYMGGVMPGCQDARQTLPTAAVK